MPRRTDLRSVLVIGAGPIVIGQACEFDYSGTQAVKALKAEGLRVVLVNSNPATIMTDASIADRTYVEPIVPETLEAIIARERPDALLPTVGGQTALNAAVALAESGVLDRYGVRLIGASLEAIRRAEDRGLFRTTMQAAGLDLPRSGDARNVAEAAALAEAFGLPVVLRPSFTLGGTGGGIARTPEDLERMAAYALSASPSGQVLVEESVEGWKEFELEVMRDRAGNFVVVCPIENLDPMGVHTGDSITVAPAQTLSDPEYQAMRDDARRAIEAIGVETGGSNVQFAVCPRTGRRVVIEMNPRVSRSSALASKATGFPIAKIAARLALGYTLDEITNDITGRTRAAFEPSIDYVVVKVPRFAFEKFLEADQRLGLQMKSVGETMAIGRTFQEALQKALRGLEIGRAGLAADGRGQAAVVERLRDRSPRDLERQAYLEGVRYKLRVPNCDRIFNLRYALELGMSVEEVSEASAIDPWFVAQIDDLLGFERAYRSLGRAGLAQPALAEAKRRGYSDIQIGHLLRAPETEVRAARARAGVRPAYKVVDTCAAEFESSTPYFYASYDDEDEDPALEETGAAGRPKRASPIGLVGQGERAKGDPPPRSTPVGRVLILGGGPNRIGQGIEFDCCAVEGVFALREDGYETVLMNSNPETVSTDYDTADRLYFEPLTVEDVVGVVERERPLGVIAQFGGQTPLSLARSLAEAGVVILGTTPEAIRRAEDRGLSNELIASLGLRQPPGGTAMSVDEAAAVAERIGYPVLVRPSFVLGGRAMAIVEDRAALEGFVREAADASPDHPVLVDRYLADSVEVDVDAVCDGRDVLVAGIMEHVEEAGVHSGDSACFLPPVTLDPAVVSEIAEATRRIALGLGVVGLLNVQFAVVPGRGAGVVHVLEVNPRASRTVPFVSKATGLSLARIAARVMVGRALRDLVPSLETPRPTDVSAKEVVLPFMKFEGSDIWLGPEMRSTGEVMGIAPDAARAYAKAVLGTGVRLPRGGTAVFSLAGRDKAPAVAVARDLAAAGFRVAATPGTARVFAAAGLDVESVPVEGHEVALVGRMNRGDVTLVVNSRHGALDDRMEATIRRRAMVLGIPVATTLANARATVAAIRAAAAGPLTPVCLQDRIRRG